MRKPENLLGRADRFVKTFPAITLCVFTLSAPAAVRVPPNDPNIRYSGRIDFSNPQAPRFDWPAVSITTRFRGKSIGILLEDGNNDYNAFLDGRPAQVIIPGSARATTISGLSPGLHTLVLSKRTEASFGIATFHGFVLEDGMSLAPLPAPPVHRIEFIGDSLGCGAEVEDPRTDCDPSHFRTTENSSLAYGPLCAGTLGADFRITAYSAKGLIRNAGDDGTSQCPLPCFYPRLLANVPEALIDPRTWTPDAVVVFLGGNDFFAAGTPPSEADFIGAYRSFVAVLRLDYPKARIFCVSFAASDPMTRDVRRVVEAENSSGDENIRFLALRYPASDRTGCYSHPNAAGQKKIADELSDLLRNSLKWGD
jgi:lysophospholipase L1-like esterase